MVSIRICSGRIAVHSPADGEDSRAKYANSLHTGDMLLLAREYFGKTKTTLRGNGIGVTHTSGVILFSLEGGFESPLSFAYRQKAASNTPSGMEKKRDPAAKRTDLKTPGSRRQLRKDCFGARYVRQYRQVLLQAKPYISGAVARTQSCRSFRLLPAMQCSA